MVKWRVLDVVWVPSPILMRYGLDLKAQSTPVTSLAFLGIRLYT